MEKKSVLLVDDEEVLLELNADIFELRGFKVFKALKSEEAYDIYKQHIPDAVILDINMAYSEYDGVEFLRKVRATDKDITCIVLSRISDPAVHEEVNSLGISGYFEKPISDEQFLQMMDIITKEAPHGNAS